MQADKKIGILGANGTIGLVVYRLLYEELLCRLHCIIYEFLTGISYVVLNDLYNNVGLLTSDPTTLLLPKSIAVVEENVS